jgi:hypothetical protein
MGFSLGYIELGLILNWNQNQNGDFVSEELDPKPDSKLHFIANWNGTGITLI